MRRIHWHDYLTVNIYWLGLTTLAQTNGLVVPLLVRSLMGLIPDIVPQDLRGRFFGIKAMLEIPLPVILVSFTIGPLIGGGIRYRQLGIGDAHCAQRRIGPVPGNRKPGRGGCRCNRRPHSRFSDRCTSPKSQGWVIYSCSLFTESTFFSLCSFSHVLISKKIDLSLIVVLLSV